MPSDVFTVADADSVTGVRPSVAPELFSSGVFEALPASFQPGPFFDAIDGFSPLGAVSFETGAAVDAAALLAIDQPNHGERRASEGALLDLVGPASLGRVTSMVPQSSIDFVSLQKALRTSFAELDLVSSSGFFLFSARPDGRPDFDPTAMIYQGTSMGGVLGAAFLSITPEPLPAAMLQVPGVDVSHLITNSLLWDSLLGFRRVVPEAATPGEASALMAAAQMALDLGDAGNWIDVPTWTRHPPERHPPARPGPAGRRPARRRSPCPPRIRSSRPSSATSLSSSPRRSPPSARGWTTSTPCSGTDGPRRRGPTATGEPHVLGTSARR